ncbi:Acetyl esterase/lipase [Tangfeifania diversioriginum]|uniref:Acetyl esterase/lipase n=1 Tax=Tangfeifania diversioriginum TaxID=1168035 RepID=A0A1M6NXB6_9BACT|nr:alpha/beta hydrolase [Tangfeifania diversioriginum]SHK00375.1 Acetyl esterase/lipase [Tangfeifania diversioriginum]
MKPKNFKPILKGLLLTFLLFFLLMVTPQTLGFLFPERPPVGYHFESLAYLAVGIGLEKLADLEPEIPETVEEIKDVEYKNMNGKSLQMDFYRPKNTSEPLPLLVFIHGGSWKSGKRSDYLVYLTRFAQKGYITATISYRLLRDSIYPAAVEDVTDAVKWLFENGENYGYDPDRIALVGGSAGAHLAMLAGYGWGSSVSQNSSVTTARRIKAVVDIYGPVDLTTKYSRNQRLVNAFIGYSYNEKPELYQQASPITYLSSSCSPTLILHGTSDTLVPVSQSDTLKSRLDALDVPCEYYRVPLWPHAMDIAKRVNDFSQKKMEAFFEEYLI